MALHVHILVHVKSFLISYQLYTAVLHEISIAKHILKLLGHIHVYIYMYMYPPAHIVCHLSLQYPNNLHYFGVGSRYNTVNFIITLYV